MIFLKNLIRLKVRLLDVNLTFHLCHTRDSISFVFIHKALCNHFPSVLLWSSHRNGRYKGKYEHVVWYWCNKPFPRNTLLIHVKNLHLDIYPDKYNRITRKTANLFANLCKSEKRHIRNWPTGIEFVLVINLCERWQEINTNR